MELATFVTIYHWDLPQYWEETGGWLNEEVCYAYQHYAKVCFDNFKDKITHWVTFNEPKWFICSGYLIGNYPPAHQNPQETIKAAFHVMCMQMHFELKHLEKRNYPGNIGIVHSFTPVNGIDDTVETKIAMRYADNYCNNWILDTAAKGEIPIDLLTALSKIYDISFIKPKHLKTIKENTVDFLGLNYYSRTLVKPYTEGRNCFLIVNHKGKERREKVKVILKGWFEQVLHDPNRTYTEWDTEIHPKGQLANRRYQR